jgi:hypothetical protein
VDEDYDDDPIISWSHISISLGDEVGVNEIISLTFGGIGWSQWLTAGPDRFQLVPSFLLFTE